MDIPAQPAVPEWVCYVQQGFDNVKSIPQMQQQIATSEMNRQRHENEYRQYKIDLEHKARLQQRADAAERKEVMDKLDALIGTVNSMKGDVAAIKGDIVGMKGEIAELASMKGDVAEIKGDVAGMKGEIAELASMKGDVAEIKGDVAGMKGENLGIKNDVAGIRGDIAGIKDDVAGIRGDIAGIKVDIAGLSEAGDEEAIRRSNKVIGLVNKTQQNIDWTPLRAVKGLGDVLQGYEVDIRRFADINTALK